MNSRSSAYRISGRKRWLPPKQVARRVAGKRQLVAVRRPGEHGRDQRPADLLAAEHRAVVKAQRHILPRLAPVLKHPAEGDVRPGFLRRAQERLIHLRLRPVVAVAKADVIAPRRIQPRVARRRYALIFLKRDHTDSAVQRLHLAQNRQRMIRAAVADEDQLDIPQRLRAQRRDARRQKRFRPIDRDDDRNLRIHGHSPLCSANRGGLIPRARAAPEPENTRSRSPRTARRPIRTCPPE